MAQPQHVRLIPFKVARWRIEVAIDAEESNLYDIAPPNPEALAANTMDRLPPLAPHGKGFDVGAHVGLRVVMLPTPLRGVAMVKKIPTSAAAAMIGDRLLLQDAIAMHLVNQGLLLALIADLQAAGLTNPARLAESVEQSLLSPEALAEMPQLAAPTRSLLQRLHEPPFAPSAA